MKTKLFLAFLAIIFAALLSNFIFEWMIMKDFDNYIDGVKEDQFYWILASVEGSYSDKEWDKKILLESIHWAMMLGIDIKVLDSNGKEIIPSQNIKESLTDSMKDRMEELFHIHETIRGEYQEYPLYSKGEKIGILLSRPLQKKELQAKELVFKRRTKTFLYVSLLIAGGGSLLLALLFSQYISRPITNLKKAAEDIAKGDFNVKIFSKSKDEVEGLSQTFHVMAQSLKKEEELRKHLMSNIAHELRTPLAIMKANIEAIADGVVDVKEKGLENIKNEVDHLTKLINGIEDVTMAEATFFKKKEETEINLKKYLSELADDMKTTFKEKGLTINIVKDNDVIVTTDIEKLEKILRNIISNSLKFTKQGGVWIDYGIKGENFFIEIKDSGKGIPENDMPLIFKRFYKVKKMKGSGLGLGLAIVKELVSVMGGTVEVKSTLNKGTIFTLYLPSSRNS